MTEFDLMIRAVCREPLDTTPRLVLCDWLTEHAGDPCPECGGRGGVFLDDISHDKGLYLHQCSSCEASGTIAHLYQPWIDYLRRAIVEKEVIQTINRPAASLSLSEHSPLRFYGSLYAFHWDAVGFCLGFPNRLLLTIHAFLSQAEDLFSQYPLTQIEFTDKIPVRVYGDGADRNDRRKDRFRFWVDNDQTALAAHRLPARLMSAPGRGHDDYPDFDTAIRAVSRRAVALGRHRAGLPPIPELPLIESLPDVPVAGGDV